MNPPPSSQADLQKVLEELSEPRAIVTYKDHLAAYNQDERHRSLLWRNRYQLIAYIRSLEAKLQFARNTFKGIYNLAEGPASMHVAKEALSQLRS